jgi:hypothetical protein
MGTVSNKKYLVAGNFVKTSANKNRNYWSPLSCLVKEQEDNEDEDNGTWMTDQLLVIKSHPAESDDQKQNNHKMEAKSGKPIWHLGYGMHLGCQRRKGRGLLLRHWPPIQKSIQATAQIKDNGHKENATQAQSLGWG